MFDTEDISRKAVSTSLDHNEDKPTSLTEEELREVIVEIRY